MKRPFLLKIRSGRWYYRLAGEVLFHSTGIVVSGRAGNRAVAEAWVVANMVGGGSTHAAGKTLKDYSDKFFKPTTDPRVIRKRDEGRTVGLEHLRNSRRWLEMYVHKDSIARKAVSQITRGDLLAFRARLIRKLPDSRNTVNKVMATLKSVLKEAVYRQDLPADPTLGIGKIMEERRTPDALTTGELRALFPADALGPWPDERTRTTFLLAATTGMRRGELLALRWRDVDLEGACLKVERAWKRLEEVEGAPKSGKARVVPLPKVTVDALGMLRCGDNPHGPDDLVFCYDDGGRMGETWWRKRFHRALRKAEIKANGRRLVPHSLRHSLATLLAAEEYDKEKLRAALGWADDEIRQHYTHLNAEHLKGQAEIVDKALGEKKEEVSSDGAKWTTTPREAPSETSSVRSKAR